MHHINSFILIFFLFYTGVCITAQKKLSLNEAVVTALNRNIEIQKTNNELKSFKSDRLKSLVDLLPRVNASSNLFSSTGTNFDQLSGLLQTETGRYVNGSVTVSWDILNILNKYTQIKRSEYNYLNQQFDTKSIEEFITLSVIANYLEILQAYNQDDIYKKFTEIQEKNVKRTSELIKVGVLPNQDYYIQNAEWSRLKSLKEDNLKVINSKKNELLLLLKLNPITVLDLETKVNEVFLEEEIDIDKLYQKALVNRNDLKRLEAEIFSKKYQIKFNKTSYFPKLSLYYTYGSSFSSFQERSFNDQFFKDNITKTYGLSVQVPIFNGLRNRNVIYKSKIDLENLQLDIEQFKMNIYVEISNVKNSILANRKKKIFRQDQFESSKKVYELEEERYYLEQGNSLDLGLAQKKFVEASLLLNQINSQLIFNSYELLYFSGSILEPFSLKKNEVGNSVIE